ncbi:MAG: hypothetical protein AB7I18_04680 [Candidatus Berkiella sp.]
MSFPSNIVEGYINEVVRPLGNLLVNTLCHPLQTAENVASAGVQVAQSNPYTCATILGLGAFAMYRGNLRFENNKVFLRCQFDTPLGACNVNTSFRLGPKLR